MKIKVKVSEAVKRATQEHHQALTDARNKFLKLDSILSKLKQEHEQASAEVEQLEASIAANDAIAVEQLAIAQTRLNLIESRLHSALTVNQRSTVEGKNLGRLLSITRDEIVYPAFKSAIDALTAEAAEKFRPYFRPGGWAAGAARRSDLVMSFAHYIERDFGQEPSLPEVRRALTLCEAVIAGEIDYEFETD